MANYARDYVRYSTLSALSLPRCDVNVIKKILIHTIPLFSYVAIRSKSYVMRI